MRLAVRGGIGIGERFGFAWFRLRKRIRQFIRYRPGTDKSILFIVGCQRSGTSMAHHLFRMDWDTVTFDEISPLSNRDEGERLRWNSLSEVQNLISAARSPFVVCKPLVETQNLGTILAGFPDSKAIWMYRDFRDVVASNLRYFGKDTGHRDLAPILAGDTANWRFQGLGNEATNHIRALYHPKRSGEDAAALFWYARNSLYFSGGHMHSERVALCRYGDLVTDPGMTMRAAYGFADRPYPGDRITVDVTVGSLGKGRSVAVSGDVDHLCSHLLARLDGLPSLGRRV